MDLVGRYKVVSSHIACSSSPHKSIYVSRAVFCTQGVDAAFTLGHKQGLKALSISHGDFWAGVNQNSCQIWFSAVLKVTRIRAREGSSHGKPSALLLAETVTELQCFLQRGDGAEGAEVGKDLNSAEPNPGHHHCAEVRDFLLLLQLNAV